ncbi:hypothetical protein DZC30_19600 [Comamonas testosteroni]|uniref:Uncharacterized protein n=1 Tax=Comamonas testosteroni TaxID=285 RepID=A0A373FBW9_COMTE|nr:hypothetical protein [Comamonas testosteroni]RGE40955.1 hypothetical protein DZC30_19600 [Comamonas testosteroni]
MESSVTLLTSNDLEILKQELLRPELRIYTVVVMATRDLESGDVSGALARLRVDADKLRAHNTQITRLLRTASENREAETSV